MAFLDTLKARRSIYALDKNTKINAAEIDSIIKEAVKHSPTAFNSQTQCVAVLHGAQHAKFWEFVAEKLAELQKDAPQEAKDATTARLAGFSAGAATALFFEDQDIVKGLQEKFALYAENFPIWSEQAHGIAVANAWTALSEAGVGCSLQHYNPIVDDKVAATWNIPSNWKLRGQLVIGNPIASAADKQFSDIEARVKSFA